MRDPIDLGPGIAPDVTIFDGLVHVAFGSVNPMRIDLVTLTLEGIEIRRTTLPCGFDQSFPRFSAPWLVYRQDEAHGFKATALHLRTGLAWPFSAAGATFGLTVNAALGLCAYEWKTPTTPWRIWFGSLDEGTWWESTIEGAPDGLDTIAATSRNMTVSLRKDTRGDVAGIWYPVDAGDLTVGELRDSPSRPNGGIGVQLAGDVLRALWLGQNTPDPRCASDGSTYAIVSWGATVRLQLASAADLRALPPVESTVIRDRQPGPINTDKDTSMQAKPLPADVHAIVVELHARNLTLAHGSDDDRRALTKKIAETVRARKGPSWGWKSNHGVNIANAKDAIAQLPEGATIFNGRQPLYMWDLFNGGTRAPNPLPILSETEHVEQFFVQVFPIDHLADVAPVPAPPVDQPPAQPPAPPVDLAPVVKMIADLRAIVVELAEDVEALQARPVFDQASVDAAVAAAVEGYEVRGKTAVSYGHQHGVRLAITRKA